ncbi:MAG TPA: alkaline phosphatase D family protein, partial [Burkholderiaceae bacterium]|nr:alkaline phosphatase D family protein [Burkholderiaceae bacterium]
GLQIGDVTGDRALVWARADRPARLWVEWSLDERFTDAVRVRGPHALAVSDYTTRLDLKDLPPNRTVFVRVYFENLEQTRARSDYVVGRVRTPPARPRNLRFVWGGDTAGQGWGIDPAVGGMRIYETMRRAQPDFFIHCGDTIYADGPMQPRVTLADGTVWTNAGLDLYPAKTKVAETLDEFRANYLYNLLDDNVRRFNAEVPQVWQWDDHEVTNNWSDAKDLSADARYTEKRVPLLIANATRAFLEYAPLRWHGVREEERVYRKPSYGPDLDLFVIDMRSYRAANSDNRQPAAGPDTALLGPAQVEWLKEGLRRSRATWKIIASDMPIGLVVGDGRDALGRPRYEAVANGDGPVLGREFEIADILRTIKHERIVNVVWLTADVHYCAAHYYDPNRAQFQDFLPFWEFVAGPLNAGTFGPNALDNTFGPQVVFQKAPPAGQANLPPSAGMQFFGQVDLDDRSKELKVSLKDLDGNTLFTQRLTAQRPHGGWHGRD